MLTKNSSVSLTLFLLFTLFALVSSVSALSHTAGGVSRRDHTTLKRFIKKRSVSAANSNAAASSSSNPSPNQDNGPIGAIIGAGADPSILGSSATNSSDTSSTNTTSSTSTSTSTTTTSLTTTSTTNSTSTTSTTSTSTSTSATSSSSASTTSSQASQTPSSSSSPSASNSQPSTQVTVVQTETAASAAETSAAPSNGGSLSSSGKTALTTVLIVVAVSVGALAIIWTVFRKWKLSSSRKFDQRLNPINWEPTVDDGVIPSRPSPDAASIRSGSDGHYGATSLTRGLEHDFTAGPSHLAPVGGYADLARGPSPQPQMQEALSRGPSMTRPNYDASVPLHHQNSYGVQDPYSRY